jgi:hypothetical protein
MKGLIFERSLLIFARDRRSLAPLPALCSMNLLPKDLLKSPAKASLPGPVT